MSNDSIFWENAQGRVHLLRWGSGPTLLIALHGYGDRAEQFAPLSSTLGEAFTIYAIDLPHHGQTDWTAPYHPADLMALVEWIMAREKQQTCSLMGFSFGGRLALCLWPLLGEKIAHLYLLAPDGLETRASRGITWLPMAGRRLLINRLADPRWFLKFLGTLHRMGIIARFPQRFLEHHLNDKQRRARLFYTWLIIDNFAVQKTELRRSLRNSRIPIVLFLGEKDDIVPVRLGTYLAEDAPLVNFQLLPGGHRQLIRDFVEWWQEQN